MHACVYAAISIAHSHSAVRSWLAGLPWLAIVAGQSATDRLTLVVEVLNVEFVVCYDYCKLLLVMENMKQQPCYPRIKRILMGFQDSAKHSLNGPPGTVIDVNVGQQNVDTVESAVIKSEVSSNEIASSCKRAQAGKFVVNSRDDVASTSVTGGTSGRQDSSRQPVAGFKRPVLPVSVVMETDRSSKTVKLSETRVEGETISCFDIGGEARLCLPQLLSQVLFSIPPSTLQSVTDTLHIYFAECGTAQLEVLKQARVLPETVSRSGLVTLTDAMRICAILLHDHPPRHATPDDVTVIPVQHECFGGCRGLFWPCEYRSASSLCIECMECRGRLSPYQFISHSHTSGENHTCHWGFDCKKWRSYLMLSDEVVAVDDQMNLQKLLDKMKLLFVGKDDQDLMQVIIY